MIDNDDVDDGNGQCFGGSTAGDGARRTRSHNRRKNNKHLTKKLANNLDLDIHLGIRKDIGWKWIENGIMFVFVPLNLMAH
jgi:hypothetical protein